jgi:undecaprenol kinase
MKNLPFLRRLEFALTGLAHALRSERSFRTQALVAVSVMSAMAWLRPAPIWWATVALSIAAVLAAELFNTAIESLADHLHPERHPQIRIVKDLAAAGVLIASCGAVLVATAFLIELLQQH